MNRFAACALVFSLTSVLSGPAAWAAPKSKKPVQQFSTLEGPDYSLQYPKSWTVSWQDKFRETCSECEMMIYQGSLWSDALQYHGSWAEIKVLRMGIPPPPNWTKGGVEIKSTDDYSNELDCEKCDTASSQSCAAGHKSPRMPLGESCGHFIKRIKLPLGPGYLFEGDVQEDQTRDAAFNASLRYWVLLYDIPGTKSIHRFEFWTTKDNFERFLPNFTRLLESYRIK
jgi:hypothetical protein